VQGLPELSVLLLQNNDLTAKSAVAVAKAITRAPLTVLALDGNAICSRGLEELTRVLEAAGKLSALRRKCGAWLRAGSDHCAHRLRRE
jgi:hypothetical protein